MVTLRFTQLGFTQLGFTQLGFTLLAAACAALGLSGCSRTGSSAAIEHSESTFISDSPRRGTKKQRRFQFTYAGTIHHLKPNAVARVWLPVAQSSAEQTVTLQHVRLPGEHRRTTETRFGNKLIYFETTANEKGEIPIDVEYLVERREVRRDHAAASDTEVSALETRKFLAAASHVPVDGSLLAELLRGKQPTGPTLEVARLLYEAVDDRMKYDKPEGQGWGQGDARWACGSGFGNCTDFHSLFIAVCRDSKIPAKFEIGFPIPSNGCEGRIGGYHCWAKFYDDATKRWVAVDISEADKDASMKEYYFGSLTADRVTFTTGRDLQLVPRQQAGPVNFLVYPYVEVEGKQHTSFAKAFRYEDVE